MSAGCAAVRIVCGPGVHTLTAEANKRSHGGVQVCSKKEQGYHLTNTEYNAQFRLEPGVKPGVNLRTGIKRLPYARQPLDFMW